jgi:hypothetical protein
LLSFTIANVSRIRALIEAEPSRLLVISEISETEIR